MVFSFWVNIWGGVEIPITIEQCRHTNLYSKVVHLVIPGMYSNKYLSDAFLHINAMPILRQLLNC